MGALILAEGTNKNGPPWRPVDMNLLLGSES